jgi:hypothetical protein
MFYVGQRVVCVNDSPAWDGHVPFVRKGAIYTIRCVSPAEDCDGNLGLRFHEVADPPPRPMMAPWYCATRFRPVVERKTDISIFMRMLRPREVEPA